MKSSNAIWPWLGVLALLRAIYFVAYRDGQPFWDAPIADAELYDEAARAMAGGDWLDPSYSYRPFLYPLWLGAVYSVFGAAPAIAYSLQAILGLGTLLLTFRLAERLAGPRAGLAASVLAGLYSPLVAAETKLLDTTITTFLHTASLYALVTAGRARSFAGAGVLLGLAGLSRPPLFVFAVLAGAVLPRRALLPVTLGLAAAVLPFCAWNLAASGTFTPLPRNGGVTFHTGNHAGARGDYRPPPGLTGEARAQEREQARGASGWAEGLRWMAANPADAASLWALKLYRFALADEVPLEHDLGFEREAVPVLCTFFVPFSLLLAGGLLGAALRRDRGARLCALALAVHAATSIVFYVASRYRAPAAPALAVLAAVGAVALLERWRAGHRRSAAGLALGAAAIAAALSWNPLHEEEERRALAEFNAGYALERRGDAAGAEERYAAALALEPRMAEAWLHLGNLSARAGHLAAARARYERAVSLRPRDPRPRANLGLTYLVGTPHPERAIAHVREAARLSPEDSDVAFKLGNAHRAAGDLPAAVAAYERALRLSPALPEAWNNLGTALWALAERARDAAAWARATEALGTAVALGSAHAGRNLERLAERLSRARQPADRR